MMFCSVSGLLCTGFILSSGLFGTSALGVIMWVHAEPDASRESKHCLPDWACRELQHRSFCLVQGCHGPKLSRPLRRMFGRPRSCRHVGRTDRQLSSCTALLPTRSKALFFVGSLKIVNRFWAYWVLIRGPIFRKVHACNGAPFGSEAAFAMYLNVCTYIYTHIHIYICTYKCKCICINT